MSSPVTITLLAAAIAAGTTLSLYGGVLSPTSPSISISRAAFLASTQPNAQPHDALSYQQTKIDLGQGLISVNLDGIVCTTEAAFSAQLALSAADVGPDGNNLFTPKVLRVAFPAGAGGSASDVQLMTAAPTKMRIVDIVLYVATAVSTKTVELFTAASGGGSALSQALSAGSTGVVRPTSETATSVLPSGSPLFAHLSDSGIAGEIVITMIPTT